VGKGMQHIIDGNPVIVFKKKTHLTSFIKSKNTYGL
jgi:hypothetical protein